MSSCLNLGCGDRYDRNWTNVDYQGAESVVCYDLRKGIPFPDEEFDVVYHSHLLEHFSKSSALPFLRECYRVLKARGIIRIAVPDLERIVRVYLQALEGATAGNQEWQHNYDWITIELFDQTVRERSGGDMAAYLGQEVIPNKEFVLGRFGKEGERIIEQAERKRRNNNSEKLIQMPRQPVLAQIQRLLYQWLRDQYFRHEWIVRRILGAEYVLLQLGRFRRGGEIHLWMYDRYSLAKLLGQAGFKNPKPVGPAESQIPGWKDYHLDTEPDGTVYKPDSLYMEAIKP